MERKYLCAPLAIIFVATVFGLVFSSPVAAGTYGLRNDLQERISIYNDSLSYEEMELHDILGEEKSTDLFNYTFDGHLEHTIPGSYIVKFDDAALSTYGSGFGTLSTAEAKDIVVNSVETISLDNVQSEYGASFRGMHLTDVSDKEKKDILESDLVEEVYPDYRVKTLMDDARDEVGATAEIYNDYEWNGNHGLNGSGVRIAVIDTGVDYTHEVFGNCDEDSYANNFEDCDKIYDGYDFVNDDEDPMDKSGHGTHVASIAAGKNISGTYPGGVAPEAKIGAYKVLEGATTTFASILDSIDYIKDGETPDPDIISMSLGGPPKQNHIIEEVIRDVIEEEDMTVVAGAGNEGSRMSVLTPGHIEEVITVGATDGNNIASFSSGGPFVYYDKDLDNWAINNKPDLVAPGTISAAYPDGEYSTLGGTSMSTPMVSGAAALLLQEEQLLPKEVKSRLVNTVDDIQNNVFFQGAGKLNITSAVKNPSLIVDDPLPSFESKRVDNITNDTLELEVVIKNETVMGSGFTIEKPEKMKFWDHELDIGKEKVEFDDIGYEVVDDNIVMTISITWNDSINANNFNGYHSGLVTLEDGDSEWNIPVTWFHHYPEDVRVVINDDRGIIEEVSDVKVGLLVKDSSGEWEPIGGMLPDPSYMIGLNNTPVGIWEEDKDYLAIASNARTTNPFVLSEFLNDTSTDQIDLYTSNTGRVELPSSVRGGPSVIGYALIQFASESEGLDMGILKDEPGPLEFFISEELPENISFATIYFSFDAVGCDNYEGCDIGKATMGYDRAIYGIYPVNSSDLDNPSKYIEEFDEHAVDVKYDTPFNLSKRSTPGIKRFLTSAELAFIEFFSSVDGMLEAPVSVPSERKYYTAGEALPLSILPDHIEFYNEQEEYLGEMLSVPTIDQQPGDEDDIYSYDFQVFPFVPLMDYDSNKTEIYFIGIYNPAAYSFYYTLPDYIDLTEDDAPRIEIYDEDGAYSVFYHDLDEYGREAGEGYHVKAYTPFAIQDKIEVKPKSLGDSLPVVEDIKNYSAILDEAWGAEVILNEIADVELKQWDTSQSEWVHVDSFSDTKEVSLGGLDGEMDDISISLTLEKGDTEYDMILWNLSVTEGVDLDLTLEDGEGDPVEEINLLEAIELYGSTNVDGLNLIFEDSYYRRDIPIDGEFSTTIMGCPSTPLLRWDGSNINRPFNITVDEYIFPEGMIEQSNDTVYIGGKNILSVNNNACEGVARFGYKTDGSNWTVDEKEFVPENETIYYEWQGNLEEYEIGDTVTWNITLMDDVSETSENMSFVIVTDISMKDTLEVGREAQIFSANDKSFNIVAEEVIFEQDWYGEELEPDEIYNITNTEAAEDFEAYNDTEDLFGEEEWDGSEAWNLSENRSYYGEQHLTYIIEQGEMGEKEWSNVTYAPNVTDAEFVSFRYKVNTSHYIEETENDLLFGVGNDTEKISNGSSRTEWILYSKNISGIDDPVFNWTVVLEEENNISYHIDDIRVGTGDEVYHIRFTPKNPTNYTIHQGDDLSKAEVYLPELYVEAIHDIELEDITVNEEAEIETSYFYVNISRVDLEDWVYSTDVGEDVIEFLTREAGGNYSVTWASDAEVIREDHFIAEPDKAPEIKHTLSEIEDIRNETTVVFENGNIENVDGLDNVEIYHETTEQWYTKEEYSVWECDNGGVCPNLTGNREGTGETYEITLENMVGSDTVEIKYYNIEHIDIDLNHESRDVSLSIVDEPEPFFTDFIEESRTDVPVPEAANIDWRISKTENDDTFTIGGLNLSLAADNETEDLDIETVYIESEVVGDKELHFVYAVGIDRDINETYAATTYESDDILICENFDFTNEQCLEGWEEEEHEGEFYFDRKIEAFAVGEDIDDTNGNGNGNGNGVPSTPYVHIETREARDVSDEAATLVGEVTSLDNIETASVYFRWRKAGEEDWEETSYETISDETQFEETISGLEYDTDYEYKAVIEWNGEEDIGSIEQFNTNMSSPDVSLASPDAGSDYHSTEVELRVDVTHPQGYDMDVRFYDASDDTLLEEITGIGDGMVSYTWSDLEHGNTYEWYVEIEDEWQTVAYDTWQFSTISQDEIDQLRENIDAADTDIEELDDVTYDQVLQLIDEAQQALEDEDYREAREKFNEIEDLKDDTFEEVEPETEGLSFVFILSILGILVIVILAAVLVYRYKLGGASSQSYDSERYQKKFMNVHSQVMRAIDAGRVSDPAQAYQLLEAARVALDEEKNIQKFNNKLQQVIMFLNQSS